MTLVVRKRDLTLPDDFPWILIEVGSSEVFGDYPTQVEAETALHRATHCTACDEELERPDARCTNPWCERAGGGRDG